MLRVAPLVILAALLALASPAQAGPASLVSLAVGPDGPASPEDGEPYYLWLTVSRPEGPSPAKPEHDCGAGEAPPVEATAEQLVDGILEWRPWWHLSFEEWFPTCLAAATPTACYSGLIEICSTKGVHGYVAYDVATGRYYATASTPGNGTVPAKPTVGVSGHSGVGAMADCVACPQPP